jgi:hypothetical protein
VGFKRYKYLEGYKAVKTLQRTEMAPALGQYLVNMRQSENYDPNEER